MCVYNLLQENHQYTVSNMHHKMATHFLNEASHTKVYLILTETLNMSEMCAWWVPQKLSEYHRTPHMGFTLDFLTRFEHEGNNFLVQIVTEDDSWFHYWTLESKERSKVRNSQKKMR